MGTVWYLLGRQLFNQGRFEQALPYLEKAGQLGLGGPQLAAENLRLMAVSNYHRKKPAGAFACLAVLAQYPRHPGELARARDWLERQGFEQDRITSGE